MYVICKLDIDRVYGACVEDNYRSRVKLIVGDIIVPKLDLINNGLMTVLTNCVNTSVMIQETCLKHYKVLKRCIIKLHRNLACEKILNKYSKT